MQDSDSESEKEEKKPAATASLSSYRYRIKVAVFTLKIPVIGIFGKKYGHAFLELTRQEIDKDNDSISRPEVVVMVVPGKRDYDQACRHRVIRIPGYRLCERSEAVQAPVYETK